MLQRALQRAGCGGGELVVVEGPAGIGKTRLLREATVLARSAGMGVVATRALEREQGVPWAVAARLLTGPVRTAAPEERGRLLAGQAALAAGVVDPSAPRPEDRHSVLRGLYWLTVHLTSGTPVRPLLLAVDDVQWTDGPSSAFLAHLAARVHELPVTILLAVRTGEEPVGGDVLEWVRDHRERQVLMPAALTLRGVETMVTDELGSAEPEFVSACARVTGGNPFLVSELTRTLKANRTPTAVRSVPEVERLVPRPVLEAVLTRLRRLGEPARSLAAAVAVLGDGAALRWAARLADVDPTTAERAADVLAASHILEPGEPLRFTHPLIARVVYTDLSPFACARAHQAAAELLASDGRPAVEVAAHLLLTRPDGRAETVRTLRDAARVVLAQGDPRAALRLLHRALAEPPEPSERLGALLQLATVQVACCDDGAEASIEAALAVATDPAARAAAHTVLASARFARSDHLGAAQAFDLVLTDLGPQDPSYERILGQYLTAATFQVQLRGRTRALLAPVIAAAAAPARRLPEDPCLLAHLALRAALGGGSAAQVRALADSATRVDPLVDADTHGTAMGMLVHALVAVDDVDTAQQMAEAALAEAQRRGSVLMYANASYQRAMCRYRRGALTAALDDLEQSLRASQESRQGGVVWIQALTARVRLERGEVAAASAALLLPGPTSQERMDHAVLLAARAEVALAAGDPSAALRAATDAGRHLACFGIDHSGLVAWRPAAARAASALDEPLRAARLLEQELERCRAHGVPSALSRALRTAAALGQGGAEQLEEAASLVRGGPCALEHAHALVALGAARRRAGDDGPAQSRLRTGLELADACGAWALAKLARDELRATGARPRRAALSGAAALTPSERRIAEMAAAGLSNLRIAQDLFVTPKTVETHLTNAFRKLGIRSRRQLAAALAAPAALPAAGGGRAEMD